MSRWIAFAVLVGSALAIFWLTGCAGKRRPIPVARPSFANLDQLSDVAETKAVSAGKAISRARAGSDKVAAVGAELFRLAPVDLRPQVEMLIAHNTALRIDLDDADALNNALLAGFAEMKFERMALRQRSQDQAKSLSESLGREEQLTGELLKSRTRESKAVRQANKLQTYIALALGVAVFGLLGKWFPLVPWLPWAGGAVAGALTWILI